MMRLEKVELLEDTLLLLDRGEYLYEGRPVKLKLTREQMTEARVLLPREVEMLGDALAVEPAGAPCAYFCENEDSFALACRRFEACGFAFSPEARPEILVLNMANAIHPGGGVRRGATAQEEDLCRSSSLLLSLESEAARPYYTYNLALNSALGSDAVVLSPRVEIFRHRSVETRGSSVVVSVLSCAAPVFEPGRYGLGEEGYNAAILHRIEGLLCAAAHFGYRHIILGAFGCGAFGNDARVVSDLFKKALTGRDYGFREVDFAVLDHTRKMRNFTEFNRNFANQEVTE